MLIKQRKGSKNWYTAFRVRGQIKSLGTTDKTLATELAAGLYNTEIKTRNGAETDALQRTWEDLCTQWVKRKASKKTIQEDINKLEFIETIWGSPQLNQIDTALLDSLAKGIKGKPATVNRYFALVRAMLRMANRQLFDSHGKKRIPWTDMVPAMPMQSEPKRKVIEHGPDVFWKIYNDLVEAGHETHANAALVAITSGLRDENVFGLKKEKVDIDSGVAWVHDDTKNGLPIALPLPAIALAAIKKEMKKTDSEYVFVAPKGKRFSQGSTKAFRSVAGKYDLTWHSLRHLFAKIHKMIGTPKHIIQSLGSWETGEMVDRYGYIENLHHREHVDGAADYLMGLRGTVEVQSLKPSDKLH